MNVRKPRLARIVSFVAACLLAVPALYAAEPPAKVDARAVVSGNAKPATGAKPGAATKADPLLLDPTSITGHKGLPRVLYIVPWKRADADDASGRPAGSLLDEVLAPVDRAEFRRQQRYYDGLNSSTDPDPDPGAGR